LTDAILVLNAGSSSIKFSLFPGEQRSTRQDLFCEGECAGPGHRVHFTAKDGVGAPLLDEYLNQGTTHEDALAALLHWIGDCFPQHRLIAAGHRVVHGGALYEGPVLIDAEVIAELTGSFRSPLSINRITSPPLRRFQNSTRPCRRSPALIPPSTTPSQKSPPPSLCRAA